jgi:uncharacterized phage-associated protein
MPTALDVAKYFLEKDTNREIFNMKLIDRDGHRFYEGNAKLNKFLHLAQNMHIAKTGTLLFGDAMYAFANGAVVEGVWDSYAMLHNKSFAEHNISGDLSDFLDRLYYMLKPADVDELIALSHEDEEWVEKSAYRRKRDQKMDSASRADEFKKQYADALMVMYRMDMGGDA